MNAFKWIRLRQWHTVLLAGVVMTLAVPCFAGQQSATLLLKNGGRAQGMVRYLASTKGFEINDGKTTKSFRVSEIDRIILAQQPAGLEQAVQAVNNGNYASAIPVLVKIAEEYTMLGPDVIASQALALAYLRTNRTKEALKVCEDLIKVNPQSIQSGAFASVYWETLIIEDRISTLRTSLRDAIETGGRDVAAVALVRRGDLEMKDNNPKLALLDGYLRVILLFQDVALIQPEALYKAIKAHEKLNEVQFAERWRKRLLAGYATSEFAKKLQQ